jgi:hypothetical protein
MTYCILTRGLRSKATTTGSRMTNRREVLERAVRESGTNQLRTNVPDKPAMIPTLNR